MPRSDQGSPECRFCLQLQSSQWQGREYFQCREGRFDDQYGKKYFVWGGVWQPNQKVAAAQKGCPCFKLHPQAKHITRRGRP